MEVKAKETTTSVDLPYFTHKTTVRAWAKRNFAYVEIGGITLPEALCSELCSELSDESKIFNDENLPVDLEDLFELDQRYRNVITFAEPLPSECWPDRIVRIDGIVGFGWPTTEQVRVPDKFKWVERARINIRIDGYWETIPMKQPRFTLFVNRKGLIRIWINESYIPKNAGFEAIKVSFTLTDPSQPSTITKLQKTIDFLRGEVETLKAKIAIIESKNKL